MKNRKIKKASVLVAALQVGQQASGAAALANTVVPVTTPGVPTHNGIHNMHDSITALTATLQTSTSSMPTSTGNHTTHDSAPSLTTGAQNSAAASGTHHNHFLHSNSSVTTQQGGNAPAANSIIHAMVQASGYQTSSPTVPHVHTGDPGQHLISGNRAITTAASEASTTGSSSRMLYNSSMAASSSSLNNLDLSSTQTTVVANSIPHFKDVTIQLENSTLQVTGQTKLTESEAAAVLQVLSTGHQNLVLNSSGVATGGTLKINKGFSNNLTELVVPKGVTVDDKVGHSSTLNLSNGLTNNGTLDFITVSSYPVVVTVSASNILNGQGAHLLLTQNPASALSSGGTLGLNYSGTFQNLGLINSVGSLSVTGSTSSVTPLLNVGTMQAHQGDLSLTVPGLTNHGSLRALNGNLDISSSTDTGLTVNNSGGHLSASNAINISANPNVGTGSTANFNLHGGTVTANSINLVAPNSINVDAKQMSGPVNLTGVNALVSVNGGTLNIASANLSGDPFLSNSNGNVNINSSQLTTNGDSFVALASGSVIFSGKGTLDTTVVSGAKGGDVTIGSGVTFSGQTITGASTTGGDIKLGSLNILTNGGNVTLDARAGTTSKTGGAIAVGDIDTHAGIQNGQLNGGNVTISAANSSTIGDITASGLDNGSGAGGNGGTVSITISKTGASLVVGNIDVHGGAGAAGTNGTAGNGGDGGTGGSTYTAGNYNLQGTGGSGGMAGSNGPAGGAGGTAGNAGSPGDSVGTLHGGTGGDGGTATPANGTGIDGGHGGDGQAGGDATDGFKGYDGGDAGNITIKTSGAVTTGALLAYGGQGGDGGNGNTGGQGGNGGNGGHGDYAAQPPANQGTGNGTDGGKGGDGGDGGNGGTSGMSSNGNDGGSGGKGGQVSVTTGGNFTISTNLASYQIDVSGGNGGSGGGGGRGQTGATGGNGGDGASGGTGGMSGSTYTPPADGNNAYLTPAKAGDGGTGGNGGKGGDGADGGDGGNAGKGGDGGDAGNIVINMPSTGVLNAGSFGLNASIAGGFGGDGGFGGSGGAGGWAGSDSSKGLQVGLAGTGGLAGFGYTANGVPPNPPNYNILPQPPSSNGANGNNGTAGTAGGQGDGGDGGDGGKSAFNGSFTFNGATPNIYAIQGSTYVGSSGSGGYLPTGGAGGGGGTGKTDGQTGNDGASTVTSGVVTINGGGGGSIVISTPGTHVHSGNHTTPPVVTQWNSQAQVPAQVPAGQSHVQSNLVLNSNLKVQEPTFSMLAINTPAVSTGGTQLLKSGQAQTESLTAGSLDGPVASVASVASSVSSATVAPGPSASTFTLTLPTIQIPTVQTQGIHTSTPQINATGSISNPTLLGGTGGGVGSGTAGIEAVTSDIGGTATSGAAGTVGVNDTNISQEFVQSKDPSNRSSIASSYHSSSPIKMGFPGDHNSTSYLPEVYRSLVQGSDSASNVLNISATAADGVNAGNADSSSLPDSAILKQPVKLVAFAEKSAVLASASASALSSDTSTKAIMNASALNAVVVSDSHSIDGWLKDVTTACGSATTIDQTGNYLVIASEATVVSTKFGQVRIARGAVALVCYSDEALNVMNLADNGSKSVIVESGKDSRRLLVGQQLLVSKEDAADFSSINQLGRISWRRPVKQTFNGYRAFLAEFSVISAIQQLSPLQQLLNSNDKQSKKFITNLLKVAVLISNGSR